MENKGKITAEAFLLDKGFTGFANHSLIPKWLEDFSSLQREEDRKEIIRNFFVWMVREAKIEVIDAEEFIEVHSLAENGMAPVLTLNQLIEHYISVSTPSTNGN